MISSPGSILVNIPDTNYFVLNPAMADLAKYFWVEMGPIHGLPEWHVQSNPSRHPFPTEDGALLFAAAAAERHPDREIAVAYPDGSRLSVPDYKEKL